MEPLNFDALYATAPAGGAFGPAEWQFLHCLDYLAATDTEAPRRALDVGCGDGRHARHLVERGWHVTGIDASAIGLQRAAERLGSSFAPIHHRFEPGSERRLLTQTDLISEPFALVIASTFLDHLADDVRSGAESFVAGRVADGGHVYVNAFSTWDPGSARLASAEVPPFEGLTSETVDPVAHYYRPGELAERLSPTFEPIFVSQSFEQAMELPLHHHGFVSFFGSKRP